MDKETFEKKKDQIKKVRLNTSVMVSPGSGEVIGADTEVSREAKPELVESLLLTYDNVGEVEDAPIQIVEWYDSEEETKGTSASATTLTTSSDSTEEDTEGEE